MAKPEFPLALKTRRNYWRAIYYNRECNFGDQNYSYLTPDVWLRKNKKSNFPQSTLSNILKGNVLICCQDIGENSGRKQDKRHVGEISQKILLRMS